MSNHGQRFGYTVDDLIGQCIRDNEAWFPDTQSVGFLTLCIAGEVGEVANIVKKVERGSLRLEDAMETLPEEVVDILIYLCSLMGHSAFEGVAWRDIWNKKRLYNEMRFGDKTRTDTRDLTANIDDVPEESK